MSARSAGCVIIETNLALVASGECDQASEACVAECQKRLRCVIEGAATLALDTGGHILAEYKKQLSASGEPRLGDRFLKWVYNNQWSDGCTRVDVVSKDDAGCEYAELDDLKGIEGFDSDDRKFLATAVVGGSRMRLLNAVDSDWLDFKAPIEAAGVNLEFVCGEGACVRGTANPRV